MKNHLSPLKGMASSPSIYPLSSEETFPDSSYTHLKAEQNLPLGAFVASGTSLAGALVWTLVTVTTGYQIGYVAAGLGMGVGYTMQRTGRGTERAFGIVGAALALAGSLLGNLLSAIGLRAQAEGMGMLEIIARLEYESALQLLLSGFSPADLLFYGMAMYTGYHFSFQKIPLPTSKTHAVA